MAKVKMDGTAMQPRLSSYDNSGYYCGLSGAPERPAAHDIRFPRSVSMRFPRSAAPARLDEVQAALDQQTLDRILQEGLHEFANWVQHQATDIAGNIRREFFL